LGPALNAEVKSYALMERLINVPNVDFYINKRGGGNIEILSKMWFEKYWMAFTS
jgi:hypothetical protein